VNLGKRDALRELVQEETSTLAELIADGRRPAVVIAVVIDDDGTAVAAANVSNMDEAQREDVALALSKTFDDLLR
jgi:hypothetical protein